ncbi:MAG: thioredoxin family protein [Marinomonas sp.]
MQSPLLALLLAASTQTASEAVVEERDEATSASAAATDAQANAGADFAVTSDKTDSDEKSDPGHPEAKLYDASIDASAAVDAALARAAISKANVLIVLGANWCHDSRAFAGWSETDKIGGLIKERFELVFVNVGMPQTGDGHNQHIARRFGFAKQEGTPLVIMTSYDGIVLNPDTAQSWRNTASRSEDEIYEELAMMATTEIARE